ncbi:MAG: IgA Peptidase M64 [Acidobacteriales bacterium]|nr:IgA Peptidase M64 [Terriglobales bacterium]
MKPRLRFIWLLMLASSLAFAAPTMRVDYYHTGNTKQELFSLERIVVEPLAWPGSPAQVIDDTGMGNYFFEVRDLKSDKLLYSRGFNSVYGEWVTTDEAAKQNRTFSESLRFPEPDAPVKIVLQKRDDGQLHQVWSLNVDPHDKFVDPSHAPSPGSLMELQKNGDPQKKVDLLIMGDGYTAAERGKFVKDARRLLDVMFNTSPYREHRSEFNVWGLCPAAVESGIARPSSGIHHRNPVGSTYDTFDVERYILTTENRTLRDYASYAPYEFVELLVNGATYGGGGIFNDFATVAADNQWSPYVFVHEFGHHFAGLADEYYTSQVAYIAPATRTEPWEPNVTALLDPQKLKWKDLVGPGVPIPTPWHKEDYEAYEKQIQAERRDIRAKNLPESEMNKLFQQEREHEDQLLASEKYAGSVGAFEGANYEAHGYYRPQVNCIMFTRHDAFCSVCRRGIERIIAMYSTQ